LSDSFAVSLKEAFRQVRKQRGFDVRTYLGERTVDESVNKRHNVGYVAQRDAGPLRRLQLHCGRQNRRIQGPQLKALLAAAHFMEPDGHRLPIQGREGLVSRQDVINFRTFSQFSGVEFQCRIDIRQVVVGVG